MATCKNCIHDNACASIFKYYGGTADYVSGTEKLCKHFADNSRFVELPCKIGDSLWCVYSPPHPANPVDKGKWYMGEFEVARFHYGVKGVSIEMYGFSTVAVKEIGKTVFLSREEAEKALAERRNNDKS